MSLHKDWVKAKKEAQAKFKEAEKNYLKQQDKLVKEKEDPKARKKALDMALNEAGFGSGESLSDYLKFADAFGDALDKLENSVSTNAKLQAKYSLTGTNKVVFASILTNKDLLKLYMEACKRAQNEAPLKYYLVDYKKSPDQIYSTYVMDRAPQELDFGLDPGLKDDWDTAHQNQTLGNQGSSLANRLRDHVKVDLEGDMIRKFKADPAVNKKLGIVPGATLLKLKAVVLNTATKYEGQINKAKKRWSKHQPQFWAPLETCLADIRQYCTQV